MALFTSISFFAIQLFPLSSVARHVTFDDSKTTVLSHLSRSFAIVFLFLLIISSSIVSLDIRCSYTFALLLLKALRASAYFSLFFSFKNSKSPERFVIKLK